ncbi:MAG: hypothetical protein KDH88_03010 [Chromatiales bacterium]|nr:hypothetical protein [Chromatiales bacterium]
MRRAGLFVLVIGFVLTACSGMSLRTLYVLATTDVLSLNPELLRVAVRVPDRIALQRNGATLTLGLQMPGKARIERAFPLLEAGSESDSEVLRDAERFSYTLKAYRVRPEDVAAVQQFLAEARQAKARWGKQAQGQISISPNVCHRSTVPPRPILVSSWLKITPEAGYVAISEDADLYDLLSEKTIDALLPPCD